jgi:hypothetical protein
VALQRDPVLQPFSRVYSFPEGTRVTDLVLFGDEVPPHQYIQNTTLSQPMLSQGLHVVVTTSSSTGQHEVQLLDLQGVQARVAVVARNPHHSCEFSHRVRDRRNVSP